MLSVIFLFALCASNVVAFMPNTAMTGYYVARSRLANFEKVSKLLMSSGETDQEIKDRIRKKMRKNMYNEKGVAYAPWVTRQIDEEAILEDLFRKEKGEGQKKVASILDRGEIEASEGMKWRLTDGLVDMVWSTAGEPDNFGFIVQKRPSYGGDFQEIASYKEVTQLVSKGPAGGRYRYTDPSTASGSWIYRVMDCDRTGSDSSVLCQCFVEVQSDSESKFQGAAAIGIVVLMSVLAVLGYSLDPPK